MPTETNETVRIRLRIGDAEATATLDDSYAARDFASLLPVTLQMHDLFGREKPGALPRELEIRGAPHEYDYEIGEVAYWPPSHDLVLFYAHDGQSIPAPGLVRLGTIDSGLEVIASAGDSFPLTVEIVQ
ncbi:cyclophilin-like fold protein [Agromyces sp. Soil535]|uniref:cyclophilin-like fold protein n=1 Tax=Agromyces sp. Soil535 TaxID=1736390 RepID=UPI0006F3FDEA|nr:cyclophilin-like fold protein [Agromyces sp. Soil535]KRE31463.1 hypothetical protein ASG80_03235 [Agromyces sp. Soil535]